MPRTTPHHGASAGNSNGSRSGERIRPVEVHHGTTSQGNLLPAQTNQPNWIQNDADVTAQLVVNAKSLVGLMQLDRAAC